MMAMILILLFEKSSYNIYMFYLHHKEKEKKNKKSQVRATFKCLLSCPFKSEAMVSGPKDT